MEVISLIDKMLEVIYGCEIKAQNMPNAPPDLLVIRGFNIKRQMNYRNDSIFETLLWKGYS